MLCNNSVIYCFPAREIARNSPLKPCKNALARKFFLQFLRGCQGLPARQWPQGMLARSSITRPAGVSTSTALARPPTLQYDT